MKATFLFVIVILLSFSISKADIIYTDVNPDTTLKGSLEKPWDNYDIDLDSDGTDDFTLTHFYPSDDLHYTEFQVIYPQVGEILVDAENNPLALNYDSEINSSQYKWLELTSFAIHVRDNWKGAIDKFIGVRMIKSNEWIYGWIRLDIPVDESHCILKDFACETQTNKGIKAGEKSFTATPEQIESYIGINTFPNPASDYIEITGDMSFLRKQESTIKIYNILGECVASVGTNNYLPPQRIDISTLPPGVYFIKANGKVKKFLKY